MRQVFAHRASLHLDAGADPRAPGAAVTAALCGHWEHEGPCRWPHLSIVEGRSGDLLALRVPFAAADADEASAVRESVVRALRLGSLADAPTPSSWRLVDDGPDGVRPDEAEAAARLAVA